MQEKTPIPDDPAQARLQMLRSDRLRALGEMAAGMAHELNQPLGGIRALAEQNLIALRRGWPIHPAEQAQEMQLIVEQADRMNQLISHMRQFARQAGEPEVQPTDLHEVVEAGAGMLRQQMCVRGVTLELDLTRPLPHVEVNPFSMEEALLILLSNARDAAAGAHPEGDGRVVVRTEPAEREGQAGVEVTVTDNGPGIAPDQMERVFEPFYTTKEPGKGTGLGLAIARTIVESFGGWIGLESHTTGGLRARIWLPAAGAGKEGA